LRSLLCTYYKIAKTKEFAIAEKFIETIDDFFGADLLDTTQKMYKVSFFQNSRIFEDQTTSICISK
jgi:hypothetical protein